MAGKAIFLPTLVGYAVALAASFFLVATMLDDGAVVVRGGEPTADARDRKPVDGAPT